MLIVKFHKNEFLLFRVGQNLGLLDNKKMFCWIGSRPSWSGRADLNCRPSEPHSDALTKLRYARKMLSQN